MTPRSLAAGLLLAAVQAWGQQAAPSLSHGVVSYTDEKGQRREIKMKEECADLWVSPDEGAMAFIAIEKAKATTSNQIEPWIEESAVIVARKTDNFSPIRVAVNLELGGRSWNVAREPKLSPDLATLYFFVPNSMTSWTLVSRPLNGSTFSTVAYGKDYCVVWGGSRSGDLLILKRLDPEPGDPNGGATYPCYVKDASGTETKLADRCFASFDRRVAEWSRERGGACR